MSKIVLTTPKKGHLLQVVNGLVQFGWTLEGAPDGGNLLRNGQKMLLRTNGQDLRLRLFVYKVTGSSRNKPEERRIEITSTYQKGLVKLRSYNDVVLGYETNQQIFVGVDSERMKYGGPTGNASSFFDIEGLRSARSGVITVLQRKAKRNLFPKGFEFHAFFSADRIAEYLLNRDSIHSGTYENDGEHSGRIRRSSRAAAMSLEAASAIGDVLILKARETSRRSQGAGMSEELISRVERGELITRKKSARKITPEEFLKLKRAMEENGALGEELVIESERKRLRRAGLAHLAEKIRWISRESVGEGYDIESFEVDGTKRFIEVKASIGNQNTFEMSDNEWQVARDLNEQYYICRVSNVRKSPTLAWYRNPQLLEQQGKIQKTASGWRVTLR